MGQLVSFKANGGTCQGYLATPEGTVGPRPAIVVIQEWWGLVPHIEDLADRFAREGFLALAPDLYHGQQTEEPDEAGKLMMSMQTDVIAKDLDGAVSYLIGEQAASGGKVGIVGFCLGGGLSLFEACHNPEKIAACVDFYGVLPSGQPELEHLQAPLLGIFAEQDDWMGPPAVAQLKAQLDELGKRAEVHVYPGAHHGFLNDTRPEQYDPAAAADAWTRTMAFFKEHVGA